MATEDAPPDDPPRADEPRADEPRAKDLLTRPRAELERTMDPATLAHLASWFDRPSAIVVAEQEAAAATGSVEDLEDVEFRKKMAQRALAVAAVDPSLLKPFRRHETWQPMGHLAPPRPTIDEGILLAFVRHQLERQSAEDPEPDARPYDVPRDIEEIVAKHNAPQAVLRDLFRPVTDYELRLQPLFDEPPLDTSANEARQAIHERLEPPPWIESPLGELARARAEVRAFLGEPWPEHVAAVLVWHEAEAARRSQGR